MTEELDTILKKVIAHHKTQENEMNNKINHLEEANDVLHKKICDFEIENKKLIL